jgi:hypothetical protein
MPNAASFSMQGRNMIFFSRNPKLSFYDFIHCHCARYLLYAIEIEISIDPLQILART